MDFFRTQVWRVRFLGLPGCGGANHAAQPSAGAAQPERRIEECLRRGQSEAGLADYEVRTWVGWQRHSTLSLLASGFLTDCECRLRRNEPAPRRHWKRRNLWAPLNNTTRQV